MILAANIVMMGSLFWVFYEDLKERKVTIALLMLLFVVGGFLNIKQQVWEVFLISSILNLAVVFSIILILFVYTKLKLKQSLPEAFGLGDVLFFAFMAISFPTTTFLVLFSCSLIFSFIISISFQKQLKKFVPLAGLQALFLGLILGTNHLFGLMNLYAF